MKLNPFAVMAEQFDGTGLVFNPESNAAVSLNKTGVYLWNRLKEGATETEMAAGLLEEYSGVKVTRFITVPTIPSSENFRLSALMVTVGIVSEVIFE